MSTRPSTTLETWPNTKPERPYEIRLHCPEFTCLCPLTGQPDFAEFAVIYTPGDVVVELKSLKLYLWSYRDRGISHEAATNAVLDDLVSAADPRRMVVKSHWNVRGGIETTVVAEHRREDWA
jgi:7-cyano-7-deazaguanine reductase